MSLINIFSIAWSDETFKAATESGYEVLDNRRNERPDWFELWPIRKYIIEEGLNDDQYYGFFSTKFQYKTKLKSKDVYDFVNDAIANKADVITFSPQPDQSAAFINVFEHANFYFPGFIDIVKDYLRAMKIEINIETLIMDSRTTVFSNYFVAKANFWREWFFFAEELFQIAENKENPLGKKLNESTNYGGEAQHKVFLQEEIASILLTLYSNKYKCIAANLWRMGWGQMGLHNYPNEMIISDALKIAMRDTNFPEYMDAYNWIREKIISNKKIN